MNETSNEVSGRDSLDVISETLTPLAQNQAVSGDSIPTPDTSTFRGFTMPAKFDSLEDGFVFLWRKILNSSVWWKPPAMYLALYCILSARHTEGNWRGVALKRGQLATGRHSLAQDLPFTEQQIRTALKFLEHTQFLTIQSTSKYSIITVCKYDDYQSGGACINQLTNQQVTINQPAGNHQVTTNKNDKNEKTVKKEKKNKGNRVFSNTPLMVRVGSWFGRKQDTLWSVAESEALALMGDAPPEIDVVEKFYKSTQPKEADYRRRNVITLLNNWNGEIDKARRWESDEKRKEFSFI